MSICISEAGDGGNRPLIPDIRTLTLKIKNAIDGKHAKTLAEVIHFLHEPDNATVEHILTHIRLLTEIIQKGNIGKINRDALIQLDKRICKIITELVHAQIPVSSDVKSPYHQFASWIAAIPREQPVEIFTTNYDLLMEQALEEQRVPYFDGFVGSRSAFFDIASIEHDILPIRWTRLWKLHGSINWFKTADGHIERRALDAGKSEQQMIHPSHLKYDQSRRFPYLAMQDRLKSFLAPSHGRSPSVLITCGYSFADQHLNELILQSLRGNPAAVCYGLLFGRKNQDAYTGARNCAMNQPNLQILAEDSAIINMFDSSWDCESQDQHPLKEFIVLKNAVSQADGTPSSRENQFTLGDFASFCRFLLHPGSQSIQALINAPSIIAASHDSAS